MANAFNVETVTITLADTVLSGSALLTKKQVIAECAPVAVTFEHDGAYAAGNFDVELLTGPDRVEITRLDDDGELIASITVVWFDPDEVTIQTGETDIEAGNSSDSITITAVDLTQTFVRHYAMANSDVPNNYPPNAQMDSTTQMTVVRNGTAVACTGHFWIVEATGAAPWEVQAIDSFITSASANTAIPTDVVVAETQLMSFGASGSTTTSPEELGWNVNVSAVDNVLQERAAGGSANYFFDNYVTESEFFFVQSGFLTLTAGTTTDTVTLATPVDSDRAHACSETMANGLTDATTVAAQAQMFARVELEDDDTVRITIAASDGVNAVTVHWAVLERTLNTPPGLEDSLYPALVSAF